MPIVNVELVFRPIVRRCIAGLLVLFACVIFAAIVTPKIHKNELSYRMSPVSWKPFSEAAKNSNLQNGTKVLVFVYAELNPESQVALEEFDATKVAKVCGGGLCESLLLRYDNWDDPNIRAVWSDVGHTKNPMVVLYSPNEPPRVCDPLSGELKCP